MLPWRVWLPPAAFTVSGLLGVLAQTPAGASPPARGATPMVQFRPVLCAVPAFNPTLTPPESNTISARSCSASNLLSASNMQVEPSANAANGFTIVTPPSEADLAGLASTTPARDVSSKYVLLPTLSTTSTGSPRYVLGPSQMNNASIAHASVKKQGGQWVVDYTTTSEGSRLWNRIAKNSFHRMVAIDLNGVIVSAPIIQPTQENFSSFYGAGEVGGGFSKSIAKQLAEAMNSKVSRHS